jgi:serine/threonine-protein kinase HipA
MEDEVLVYVDLNERQHLVGRLWSRLHKQKETASFKYEDAYDLNPVPTDIKPRMLSTAIGIDDTAASLELALEVAPYFEVADARARGIAAEVARSVSRWRREAIRFGVAEGEVDRMASAFEHRDLELAKGL